MPLRITHYVMSLLIFTVLTACSSSKQVQKYESSWESLAQINPTPDWFQDAKFGIYAHWGPVSSAFVGADPDKHYAGWHGMRMYENGKLDKKRKGKPTTNYEHHIKKYGDPAEYGYKYIIEQFDASGFDAKEWARLFKLSGARFAGPVAMHHDNFAMWDSKATRWNSMNYGGVDPSAALKKEIEAQGMRFMASFHHAFTWKYFAPAHAYGGVSAEDYDLYTDPHSLDSNTPSERFYKEWWAKLKEYIDTYEPDLVWFDWWLENMTEETRQKFLAYYHNKGLEWNKEVAVCYKKTTFPATMAINDYERGRPNQPQQQTWLTDTSPGAWFYRPDAKFKSADDLVDILVDIVAKNGCMLLNVPPNPDGSIPQVMIDLLTEIGAWLDVNGEAIYGTRPWTIFGEGPTRLPSGGHKVEKLKIKYTNTDVRFTKGSDKEVYAIVMDKPGEELIIKSLGKHLGVLNSNIEKIELLGSEVKIDWVRNDHGLIIKAPKNFPSSHAHAFKIFLEGYTEVGIDGGE